MTRKKKEEIEEVYACWELMGCGNYELVAYHGQFARLHAGEVRDGLVYRTEPKLVPAALLGADGTPIFSRIAAELCPKPITENAHISTAKEELRKDG